MGSSVRLDKWLWAARFFKTRALAQKSIQLGQVLYDGQKVTPARQVHIGAVLTIPQGHEKAIVIVKDLSKQRRPFKEAQLLYEETKESLDQKEKNKKLRQESKYQQIIPKPDKRPDKKSRRKLRDLRRDGEHD